jgi:hypothetical protein
MSFSVTVYRFRVQRSGLKTKKTLKPEILVKNTNFASIKSLPGRALNL